MQIKAQGVVVTGGGSGLGAATAQHLAALGAKVVVWDRHEQAAQSVARAVGGVAMTVDVTDASQVEQAFAAVEQQLSPVRAVIQCAGIAPAKKILGKQGVMPLAEFQQVLHVNTIGTFNVLRLAAQAMAKADLTAEGVRGVIINTASIAAFEGQMGQTAYSASKAAIVGLTLPAARDLASVAIRVMTIAPGIMATPLLQAMPPEVQASLAETVTFPKRLGEPQEFARLVAHILDNDYLNGEVIRLDGALRMREK